MPAAVGEAQTRAGDEIVDSARGEHLTRPGQTEDARSDVHRDPTELRADDLAFSGVHRAADLESEGARRRTDRACRAHRARRPVERREDPIAGPVDDAAAVARELAPDAFLVLDEQFAPA